MKSLLFLCFPSCWLLFHSCTYDVAKVELEYHAHVHSPDGSDKHLGDTLHIDVEFESHTGMTIHHANVRIYQKSTGTGIYSKPDDTHVEESSGMYEFGDEFVLSPANGINVNTDYVLEAKLWGHEDGEEEVMEQVEFHVLP